MNQERAEVEDRKAWLASLKPDDPVAWVTGGCGHPPRAVMAFVARLTKTQVVVSASGQTVRFRRDRGTLVGDRYTELLSVDDPQVVTVKQKMRLLVLKKQVGDLAERSGLGVGQIPVLEAARNILQDAREAVKPMHIDEVLRDGP